MIVKNILCHSKILMKQHNFRAQIYCKIDQDIVLPKAFTQKLGLYENINVPFFQKIYCDINSFLQFWSLIKVYF